MGDVRRRGDDGQFVAFISDSAKLGGTFVRWAYVHNMKTGVTEPILPTDNFDLDLSGSSRYVAVVVSGNLDTRDPTAALGFVNAVKDLPMKTTAGGMLYVFTLPR